MINLKVDIQAHKATQEARNIRNRHILKCEYLAGKLNTHPHDDNTRYEVQEICESHKSGIEHYHARVVKNGPHIDPHGVERDTEVIVDLAISAIGDDEFKQYGREALDFLKDI